MNRTHQSFIALIVVHGILSTAGTCAAEDVPRKQPDKPLTVGMLIFEGVELLDFAGPSEVFIVSGNGNQFRVVTVAASKKPLMTMGGITVTPSHDYKDAPMIDILVVPGGAMSQVSRDGIQWIQKAAAQSKVTMSVCMGAFLLAEAGLLDDVKATTHAWGIDGLKRAAPKCRVVTGKRFVDSGKIVTTGGVTAGIDGALHLVRRFYGDEAARWTAEEWMEYRPGAAASAKPEKSPR